MSWAALQAAPKKPVYVGVRVCAGCHSAAGIGGQYGKWLHSKHSAAYAVLAKPEGLEMAKLSGLRTLPQESAICLGCHATAGHAEDWEKDETFHIEDGVQCEGCHGPGSEYASLAGHEGPAGGHEGRPADARTRTSASTATSRRDRTWPS